MTLGRACLAGRSVGIERALGITCFAFVNRRGARMPATYEDANLIVQLVRWGSEFGLDEAIHALFAEDFEPAEATVDNPSIRKALQFGEVVGTLVKQDVLDRALVIDLWWIAGVWGRVQTAAQQQRDRLGEPRLYENFESLAADASS
jgi:hypothetical protein